MKIIECPVCGRRYRFDESKMSKEKITVKCRKCENNFVISKEMFESAETEAPPSSQPVEEPSDPPPDDIAPMTLVIKKIPNETARLRAATRLMPLTRERLSVVSKTLSRTPALFHFEMTPTEADNLLKAIESTGVTAEFASKAVSRRTESRATGEFPRGRWKKWVATAVLALLLATAGGLAYHMYREVQKTRVLEQRGIDSVVPKETLFYVRFKDLEEIQQKIQESPVNNGLRSLLDSLKSTRTVQDLLTRKREWETSLGIPFFRLNLMDLVGSDMRVAFYGGNGSRAPQFILTLKASRKIKLMETLAKWLPFGQERPSRRRMGQGQVVYAFQPQGMEKEIYYFSEGMIYVISTSPHLIQKSASLAKRQHTPEDSLKSVSLLSSKGKRTHINQIGLFYVGLENLSGARFGNESTDGEIPLIRSLEGYGDVVGTISYGKGLVVESTMAVHQEHLGQPLRTLLESPPTPNKTLAYVPRNAIVYASNKSLDMATHLSWLRSDLSNRHDFSTALDKILSEIRTKTGVDIEKDILPFVGGESSCVIVGADKEGGFNFPSMQLFLEVKDRSKVETSLQQLLKKPVIDTWFKEAGVDLIGISHEGVPITYLRYQGNDMRLFFLSALTPCYAFVDDFLVIGIGLENLKQVVDLSQGRGVSIGNDERFNGMKRLFSDRNSGMAYVDLKATGQLLRELITQGPLAGVGMSESGGRKAQDLQAFFQVLETLNYVRTETEFGRDRVRFLVYVAL
jgi:predicted Zn finger-like uncharacterized protein